MVSEKRQEDDPEVVGLVRKLLEPPSDHLLKSTHPIVETAQSKEVMRILENKVRKNQTGHDDTGE